MVVDELVAERAPSRLARLYELTPWWARVLVVFVVSRLVTTGILLYYASIQKDNPWTDAAPGYFEFSKIWDGHWYYIISAVGYPSMLPLTEDGHVGESAWAFMPVYPSVVRALVLLTGLEFGVVATILSVVFALGAALLFYRLLLRFLDAGTAMFSVVLLCFAPLSPIMQLAYAESMQLFLLTLALYFLVQRQYLILAPVVAVMALTRPSGLAFALALALHVVYRWWHRESEPFPFRERVQAVGVTFFSGFMGISWLLIAWAVTGSASAYTDTELAWRSAYIGYEQLIPFTPWLQAAGFWLRFPLGWLIVALAALFLVAVAGLLLSPAGRRLGPDLRFWVASYLLYLLAVFFPQSSTFRLLMPAFPILGVLAQPRSRIYRLLLVLLFIAGQWVWVHIAWYVDGSDWTPP